MIIGKLLGAIGGLATTYLDGKVAVQKANAEIKVKQATGEIDWDIEAIKVYCFRGNANMVSVFPWRDRKCQHRNEISIEVLR